MRSRIFPCSMSFCSRIYCIQNSKFFPVVFCSLTEL
uniref:Uncharacterized protein n=1 Tax=Anguilla anguilla TaxID=7936 RepID=A0A0E9QJF5_ANGAN